MQRHGPCVSSGTKQTKLSAAGLWLGVLAVCVPPVLAGEAVIPYAQTKPPGPPLSPQEAQKKMTVPDGFRVQLAAAEPDVLNPVAMTWDDRGRIWVCESLEYPRMDAGPGKDRIRILEDTDNDGTTDTVKTFAEGFNIPSGIAIGYGGVFVANAPDLLFLQDTDGDDQADKTEVLFSGFGRDDVHEVPNSLTWGPDGWLYGLNGVFNSSTISYQEKTHTFTCALWRYHPVTKAFEIFSEGTSNPWGLEYNANGDWFVSACVIDHLWHLTQTGYYHRQGGAYRPNVWKIGSIVNHKHQMRAYCGLAIYDADAYPAEYRGNLFMGNIHGGCLNRDALIRSGSTYFAEAKDDFLTGNDVWFMPVVTQVGPDGSLWVLDWYDRYHCYQDAMRDPDGVDRLRGRLWRVVYGDTPMPAKFDFAKFTNDQLIKTLSHPNVWWRRRARRLLTERNDPATVEPLKALALSSADPRGPTEALWTLISMRRIDSATHKLLLRHADPKFRAWGVRAAGEMGHVDEDIFALLKKLAGDPNPDVRLQVAIASSRIDHDDAFSLLLGVMSHPRQDSLIPHIVWENLHPRLSDHADKLADWLIAQPLNRMPIASAVAGRAIDLMVPRQGVDPAPFRHVLTGSIGKKSHRRLVRKCLNSLWAAIHAGELPDRGTKLFDPTTRKKIAQLSPGKGALASTATAILAAWNDTDAVTRARHLVDDPTKPTKERIASLQALTLIRDEGLVSRTRKILTDASEKNTVKRDVVITIGGIEDPAIGQMIVATWGKLSGDVQRTAIDVLSGRAAWATTLMAAVERKDIPRAAVNTNHVRKMLNLKDESLSTRIVQVWGRLREDRNPEREKIVQHMTQVFKRSKRDPVKGQRIFKQLCMQCHKIYGEGAEVGPDLTGNGRADLDQILSNVLDPNLVIGSGYVARNVWMKDGQVLSGLLVEESDTRIVLKIAGGQQQIIPRDQIEELRISKISLMPEELEKAISEQEFTDLIGFMLTRKAPIPWSKIPDLPAKNY